MPLVPVTSRNQWPQEQASKVTKQHPRSRIRSPRGSPDYKAGLEAWKQRLCVELWILRVVLNHQTYVIQDLPWLVWLGGLSTGLGTERSLV